MNSVQQSQQQLPLAVVAGKTLESLPESLYIPPDALRIFLEKFEGPLDLLLYLIRRHRFDPLDIPMRELTRQYLEYAEKIAALELDLAADYLMMSALLVEIKSRMLLPRPPAEEAEEGEDPRADLVRRLLEYEQIRRAAERLASLPRSGRDFASPFIFSPPPESQKTEKTEKPTVTADALELAMASAMERRREDPQMFLRAESLSVREAMSRVLRFLSPGRRADFFDLIRDEKIDAGRIGVLLLAVLELALSRAISVSQEDSDSPIFVASAAENGN